MNRRDLLKKIALGSPALAFAIVAPSQINLTSSPTNFMFHGWRLQWRDWREMENMDAKVGFWVAYSTDKHGWHIASPWPGPVTPFVPGALLDIHCLPDQTIPSMNTSKEELAWMQNEALERLKRVLVRHGPPPYIPDREQGWSKFL
jgi:hypothetical protein